MVKLPGEPYYQYLTRQVSTQQDDSCWLWPGAKTKYGYGMVKVPGQGNAKLVHLVAYRVKYGNIPSGLELGHTCHVKSCWNPNHVVPITHQENCRDRVSTLGTTCRQGHVHDSSNSIWYFHRKSQRWIRYCRACRDARNRRRYR